jgi:hypothetical protein
MSPQDFRRIALGMSDAVESAHMGHPDFRVHGRIFATLHADNRYGMVKLTPDQQQQFVRDNPVTFEPENGAWGRQGCTRVLLAPQRTRNARQGPRSVNAVDEETLGEAITLAWQNTARSEVAKRPGRTRTVRPVPPSRKR